MGSTDCGVNAVVMRGQDTLVNCETTWEMMDGLWEYEVVQDSNKDVTDATNTLGKTTVLQELIFWIVRFYSFCSFLDTKYRGSSEKDNLVL